MSPIWQVDTVRGALAQAGADVVPSMTPVLCFVGRGLAGLLSARLVPRHSARGSEVTAQARNCCRLAVDDVERLASILGRALPST